MLVLQYTPVRVDGEQGDPGEAVAGPIVTAAQHERDREAARLRREKARKETSEDDDGNDSEWDEDEIAREVEEVEDSEVASETGSEATETKPQKAKSPRTVRVLGLKSPEVEVIVTVTRTLTLNLTALGFVAWLPWDSLYGDHGTRLMD